jgi:sugar lactone lactonase YvrE
MYFTDSMNNVIHRVPASGTTAADIAGPDGNAWFTELGVDKIGKLAL